MIHVDPNSRAGKVILVLGMPFFAWMLVALSLGAYRSTVCEHWPTAAGTITKCAVSETFTAHGEKKRVRVEYVYRVDGVEHRGDTIAFTVFGNIDQSESEMERLMNAYPKGKYVDVRYDPKHPRVACLAAGGFGWWDSFMFIVALGGVVCGISLLGRAYRWLFPKRNAMSAVNSFRSSTRIAR